MTPGISEGPEIQTPLQQGLPLTGPGPPGMQQGQPGALGPRSLPKAPQPPWIPPTGSQPSPPKESPQSQPQGPPQSQPQPQQQLPPPPPPASTPAQGAVYSAKQGGRSSDPAEDELETQKWYHGLLPRRDIVEMLKKDGDFLVRSTQKNGFQIVLTHRWKEKLVHMILVKDPVRGVYRMPARDFNTVTELVKFYWKGKRPFNDEGAMLIKPIPKKPWLISHRDVDLTKKIGEGNFGEVFLGTMRYGEKRIPVAVKSCKSLIGDDQREEFMKEAKMMLQYRHDNVVRIYAIAADKAPLLMIMEHCPEGGLDGFLKKNKLSFKAKIRLCSQAARGMEYLHIKKNCIHRDLAARNCLMGVKNILKIADFGLTRQGAYKLERKNAAVPIRWTAPEALTSSFFDFASDVWSFGIMMWEIYADAEEPWPGMSPKEAFRAMRAGQKMDLPVDTPIDIGRVMHACWNLTASARPKMDQIRLEIDRIDSLENPSDGPPPL